VIDDVRLLTGGRNGWSIAPEPTFYVSARQAITRYPELLAVGPGDVLGVRARLVTLLRNQDRAAALGRDVTLASQFDQARLVFQVFGGVIGALAGAALLLSVIGIYGVVAFGIAQRRHEIGIRIALGGTTSRVLRMIANEAARFVSVGVVVGVVLSLALGRMMKALLFGVSALDPVAYGIVAIAFGVVAVVACVVPAQRVTRVDPLVALRAE